jgi:hypothetical protein
MCATPQKKQEIPVHQGVARLHGSGQVRAGLRRKVTGAGPGQGPRRASTRPPRRGDESGGCNQRRTQRCQASWHPCRQLVVNRPVDNTSVKVWSTADKARYVTGTTLDFTAVTLASARGVSTDAAPGGNPATVCEVYGGYACEAPGERTLRSLRLRACSPLLTMTVTLKSSR